ncbi:MAG: hypothetical protein ACJA1N_000934 [Saprospiraceae bacterium]|jgi:hypothetical protein
MNQIRLLKENIERKFGSKIDNVATLKRLLASINKNSDLELSYNTLRRLFDFLPSTKPNINTLNSLSQYLGFMDFHSFSNQFHFPNWETWLYVLRLKQQAQITTAVIPILNRQLNNKYFSLYFIDLATHFINQRNRNACLILFEVEIDKITRSEQLKICLALGLILRKFYKKDENFIISLLNNGRFRRTVVYNFIDYSSFNIGYMELIEASILIEKEAEHLLFLNLLKSYAAFLNGESKEKLGLSKSYNLQGIYPIVQGRYYANLLYSSTVAEQQIIFDQLLIHSEKANKSEFFFELIPTILLLKRLDWISILFSKYFKEIFEINEFNKLTHLVILQVAQALLYIKEKNYKSAANELKKVNPYLAFDSYIDYIILFSLIAKYHLKEEPETAKEEYLKLVNKLGFKLFSLAFLENYFED